MGSGVWPKQCRRSGVTLEKSIISTHPSREEACIAESQLINAYFGNEMLMNKYFGVQNHPLGPREVIPRKPVVYIDTNFLRSAFWVTESVEARIVWITMLLMADAEGHVKSSINGISGASGVSVEECSTAIEVMKSKNQWDSDDMVALAHIEETESGWKFLN